MMEHVGVIHVHTAYSDSYGRIPYIVKCANEAQLDFVIVSDHNTLGARLEGWEGWHDGVLIVAGVEISSQHGHTVVVNLDKLSPSWKHAQPAEYLPEVARLGGTSFIAHPEWKNPPRFKSGMAWGNIDTDSYAGIEVWSYLHDWFDWVFPWHLIAGLRNPDRGVSGPQASLLRRWDETALRRHVSGIGALDSHEFRFPFRRLKWNIFRVMPTEYQFRTVRTHVLVDFSGSAGDDVRSLTDALARGRCFAAYDLLADSRGTMFSAQRDGETFIMGDETRVGGELKFAASAPHDSEITLLRNSEPVAQQTGRELVHTDARPGVYRVEARIGGRPWVFTNHIYVRE